MTELRKSKLPTTRLGVLMLLFPMLALAGCCGPLIIKPDQALTTPIDTHDLIDGDTIRDMAEKYELRGFSIEEANKRFEKMRE